MKMTKCENGRSMYNLSPVINAPPTPPGDLMSVFLGRSGMQTPGCSPSTTNEGITKAKIPKIEGFGFFDINDPKSKQAKFDRVLSESVEMDSKPSLAEKDFELSQCNFSSPLLGRNGFEDFQKFQMKLRLACASSVDFRNHQAALRNLSMNSTSKLEHRGSNGPAQSFTNVHGNQDSINSNPRPRMDAQYFNSANFPADYALNGSYAGVNPSNSPTNKNQKELYNGDLGVYMRNSGSKLRKFLSGVGKHQDDFLWHSNTSDVDLTAPNGSGAVQGTQRLPEHLQESLNPNIRLPSSTYSYVPVHGMPHIYSSSASSSVQFSPVQHPIQVKTEPQDDSSEIHNAMTSKTGNFQTCRPETSDLPLCANTSLISQEGQAESQNEDSDHGNEFDPNDSVIHESCYDEEKNSLEASATEGDKQVDAESCHSEEPSQNLTWNSENRSAEEGHYSCSVCIYETTDVAEFLSHVINHCRQPRPPGTVFGAEDRKRKHDGATVLMSQSQSPGSARKKGFRCKKCEFETHDKDVYFDHVATHIPVERRFSCIMCSFVTHLRHHIMYHISNHFGIKPVRCSIDKCTYVCINQSMLKSHLKKHPILCCANCDFLTKSTVEFERHLSESNHSARLILKNVDYDQSPSVRRSFGSNSFQEIPRDVPNSYMMHVAAGMATGAASIGSAQRPYAAEIGSALPIYMNHPSLGQNRFPGGFMPPFVWPAAASSSAFLNQYAFPPYFNMSPENIPFLSPHRGSMQPLREKDGREVDSMGHSLSLQNHHMSVNQSEAAGLEKHGTQRSASATESGLMEIPSRIMNSPTEVASISSLSSDRSRKSVAELPSVGKRVMPGVAQPREAPVMDLSTNSETLQHSFDADRQTVEVNHSQDLNCCSKQVILGSSKYSRRKGVARKVVVDQRDDNEESTLQNLQGRSSEQNFEYTTPRAPSSGLNARQNSSEVSSELELKNQEKTSALQDLINVSENLLSGSLEKQTSIPEQLSEPKQKSSDPEIKSPQSRNECGTRVLNSSKSKALKTYDCNYCGIRFQNYILYSMHSGYHNFNDPLQCNFCGRKYKNFYDFYEHIGRVEHPES